jgi:DNA-binding response OmpR family regulator
LDTCCVARRRRAHLRTAISTSAREVTVAGVVADLTRIEFELLDVLSANPKVVYNRQQLLDRVWGPGWFGDDHVVDVHIANLRKKIDRDGRRLIRTVRGVGYRMADQPSPGTDGAVPQAALR